MGAGDTVFLGETLRGLGLPGAIIIVQMSVISALSTAIVIMYRHANKVTGYRLAERDILTTALHESKNAMNSMLLATQERNNITDDLSDVIKEQAAIFNQVSDRIRMHYEGLREDSNRISMVLGSVAESMLVLTGVATDSRNASADAALAAKRLADQLQDIQVYLSREPRQRRFKPKV